jgi:hypothetical protein
MSIFVTSAADLTAMVNVAGGVSFSTTELSFASPRTPTAAELTTYGKNTAVDFKVADSSTIAIGFTTVFYDRLNLSGLENFDLTSCSITENLAVAQWLPLVIGYINVPITAASLVEHASATVNGKVVAVLEATSTSLGWLGTASLKFPAAPDITTAFNSNQLIGF